MDTRPRIAPRRSKFPQRRPAAHIGLLVGARYSHRDNIGHNLDQKVLIKGQTSPEELAQALLAEERWHQILSSLVICFFATGIYSPNIVCRTLNLVRFELPQEDLNQIGEMIHREKYRFKFREEFSFDKLRLPERIFQTPSPAVILDEGFFRKLMGCLKKTLSREQAEG